MNPSHPAFAATIEAAKDRLSKVKPAVYAKTRNFLDGAVTRLSPYITHGFLTVPDCVQELSKRYTLTLEDKLIYEFAWREFFSHVWSVLGDDILKDIRPPVWRGRYNPTLPDDIRHASTGVKAIDESIQSLYETGYLHNHCRMWIASYVIHVRKVHWKVGADWMYSHLLDGELSSNHLSWQWVAGTFSHKPYLFNAENVKRYAPQWDCKGSIIDTSYEDLDDRARNKNDAGPEKGHRAIAEEPKVSARPAFRVDGLNWINDPHQIGQQLMDLSKSDPQEVTIELIHPWSLNDRDSTASLIKRVAWIDPDFHQRWGWSDQRWQFVLKRMSDLTDQVWVIKNASLAKLLKDQGVTAQVLSTMNPSYKQLLTSPQVKTQSQSLLLPKVKQLQQSFTRFYQTATAGMTSLGFQTDSNLSEWLRNAHK